MTSVISQIRDGRDVFGKHRVQYVDYALSGTYANNFTINATDVGMKGFVGVSVAGGDVSLGTYFPVLDLGTALAGLTPTSVKLRLFTASGTEATGSLSVTVNVRVCFIGI